MGSQVRSNQMKLPPYLPECGEGLVEVFSGVSGGYLAPDPRLTLGDDRIAEPGDEHTFGQQEVAHADRSGSLAQDDGDDRGLAR